jgi:hypothetical protein
VSLLRQSSLLARVAGLLVDLKLTQMDCLEALAALLTPAAPAADGQAPAAAAAGAGQKKQPKAGGKAAVGPGDEAKALLDEADRLAADLTQ